MDSGSNVTVWSDFVVEKSIITTRENIVVDQSRITTTIKLGLTKSFLREETRVVVEIAVYSSELE